MLRVDLLAKTRLLPRNVVFCFWGCFHHFYVSMQAKRRMFPTPSISTSYFSQQSFRSRNLCKYQFENKRTFPLYVFELKLHLYSCKTGIEELCRGILMSEIGNSFLHLLFLPSPAGSLSYLSTAPQIIKLRFKAKIRDMHKTCEAPGCKR